MTILPRFQTLTSCILLSAILCHDARALPAGRAWSEVDTLHLGIHFLAGPRLATLKGGRLRLVAAGITDPRSILTYDWDGDHWTLDHRLEYGSGFLWPFLSDEDEEHLVWKGIEPAGPFGNDTYLLYLQTLPELQPRADTLALSLGRAIEYSGASSPRARWVLHDDFGNLRLFRADRPGGAWAEVEMPGNGSYGTTIAALDDTSALALWSNGQELSSAVIGGTDVRLIPVPQNKAKVLPGRPKLRRRPQGGFWMAWGSSEPYMLMSRFDGTSWSTPDSIHCAYLDGEVSYIADSPDLSQDSSERPVIAWSAYSTITGRDVICVSCPTDSGYPIAEELPVTNGGFLASPARDENGDVWLAWWKYSDGAFWNHSYTAVDVSDAVVDGSPFMRRIAWTLSGPAPGSWWSVLRADDDTDFVVVGRVQAGTATAVEWTDSTTTDRAYRYRIRRDCKDTRYETLTEPIVSLLEGLSWLPLSLRVEGTNPGRGTARVRVEGAAPGPVTVEVFDVRGRRIGTAEAAAGPGGVASLNLASAVGSFPGLPAAGLYFARAQDIRGRTSRSLKIVRL